MTQCAILTRLDARVGKEDDVEALLRSIQPLMSAPDAPRSWFALRMAPEIYGLLSTFDTESERDAYLSILAQVWAKHTEELLSRPPVTEKVEILVAHPGASVGGDLSSLKPEHRNPPPRVFPEIPKVGSKDAPGG